MPEEQPNLTIFDEPQEVDLDWVHSLEGAITTLFGGGIINPMGPTATVVAACGEFSVGSKLLIVDVMLNPFSQKLNVVGELYIGKQANPFIDLPPLFSLPRGACPTLLFPSMLFEEGEPSIKFQSLYLASFEEGGNVLEKVRKHPSDPFGRVQEDTEEATGLLNLFGSKDTADTVNRRLGPEAATELATTLLQEDNHKLEWMAFMSAWEGAIEFQRSDELAAFAEIAMDLRQLTHHLVPLLWSMRMPFLESLNEIREEG